MILVYWSFFRRLFGDEAPAAAFGEDAVALGEDALDKHLYITTLIFGPYATIDTHLLMI